MKKQKKLITLFILLFFILSLFSNQHVFANNNKISIKKSEYSEDFKKWLELSDEEKSAIEKAIQGM